MKSCLRFKIDFKPQTFLVFSSPLLSEIVCLRQTAKNTDVFSQATWEQRLRVQVMDEDRVGFDDTIGTLSVVIKDACLGSGALGC